LFGQIALSVIWRLSNLTKHKLIKVVTNSESKNLKDNVKYVHLKE